MHVSLADIRKEYTLKVLDGSTTAVHPWEQFNQWFTEAMESQIVEPTAMHLATVSAQGNPSGRIVLLKGLDPTGFVFYTNYDSRKGQDLLSNNLACLTFFWPELERQVRIEGRVEKVSAAESDAYFQSRPRGSQIGAWVSHQSEVIADRSVLEQMQAELEKKYGEEMPIPRPPHWGGYRVVPSQLEFWQGRPSRLHDRIVYTLQADKSWLKQRLAP